LKHEQNKSLKSKLKILKVMGLEKKSTKNIWAKTYIFTQIWIALTREIEEKVCSHASQTSRDVV
jgi:hypothetical protein